MSRVPARVDSQADPTYEIDASGRFVSVDRAMEELTGFSRSELLGMRLPDLIAGLRHQALHDPLTGLPNRMLFHDRVEQASIASRRAAQRFAVLLVDLNEFKDVNDRHGHQTGDVVLVRVARRLRALLRASDTVARIGGDEFAVLLPETDAPGAETVADKLVRSLRGPVRVDGKRFTAGASVGIAVYPDDARDVEGLLRSADVAMYAAKRLKRGYARPPDRRRWGRAFDVLAPRRPFRRRGGGRFLHKAASLSSCLLLAAALASGALLVEVTNPGRGFPITQDGPPDLRVGSADADDVGALDGRSILRAGLGSVFGSADRMWMTASLRGPAPGASRNPLGDPGGWRPVAPGPNTPATPPGSGDGPSAPAPGPGPAPGSGDSGNGGGGNNGGGNNGGGNNGNKGNNPSQPKGPSAQPKGPSSQSNASAQPKRASGQPKGQSRPSKGPSAQPKGSSARPNRSTNQSSQAKGSSSNRSSTGGSRSSAKPSGGGSASQGSKGGSGRSSGRG